MNRDNGDTDMKYYNAYWHGNHAELYLDGQYFADFATVTDACIYAENRGYVRTPRNVESTDGAPY